MRGSEFRAAVDAALASLPTEIRDRLENVVVDILDWPGPSDLPTDDGMLLGQYSPSPVLHQGHSLGFAPPGRIKIFRRPLERLCRSQEELELEIAATVVHEIAHHFAFTESDLDAFEERVARRRDEIDAAYEARRAVDEDKN